MQVTTKTKNEKKNGQANAKAASNLVNGPITKTLLILAIPTLLSNILQSLNGSINTVWVGRFLGENALAATANATIIMFVLFSLIFGFGMAATVLVGQNIGRNNITAARQAFATSLSFCLLLCLILAILGWVFATEILTLLKTPLAAFALAKDYLQVTFLYMPASLLLLMIMMGLRGAGDSITPLIFMILNVILDVVLNPLFILGIGPFPKLGIAGSAVATLIANFTALFAMIIYIYWRNLTLCLKGRELFYLIPNLKLLRVVILKGFPMSLQIMVMATAGMVMIGLVNREGVTVAAAYNVTQQLWTYVQMPAMAVGAAVSAMVAQNIGAGKSDKIGKITTIGSVVTFVIIAIMLAVLLLFDNAVMRLFLGDANEAAIYARHIQVLASWSYLFFGISMIVFATMRATGTVIMPLIILFIAMYPVRLGFYYIYYPLLKADALWISFPVGAFAALIMAGIYYYTGHWKQTSLIDTPLSAGNDERIQVTAEPVGRTKPNV